MKENGGISGSVLNSAADAARAPTNLKSPSCRVALAKLRNHRANKPCSFTSCYGIPHAPQCSFKLGPRKSLAPDQGFKFGPRGSLEGSFGPG